MLGEIADSVAADPAIEHQRLHQAMEAAREEITRLSRRISHLVGEDHGAILQAQLMILQDSTVERDLAGCLAAGATAEWALSRTLDKYVATFQKLTNPFFQERIFDIKDVFRRILWHLRPQERPQHSARSGSSWSPTKPRYSTCSRSISITLSEWSWNTAARTAMP